MVEMKFDEPDDVPSYLLHGEYVQDRMERLGWGPEDTLADLGFESNMLPGLKLTVEHNELGDESIEVPTPLGFGCSIHPEMDFLMTAGLASEGLLERFLQPEKSGVLTG